MSNTIDPTELKIRKAILEDLKSRDIKKTGFVSAEDFQNALDGNQLTPGTELCDRIFLECTIDDNGLVFYGGFSKIVEHEANVSQKQAMIRLIKEQNPAPIQKPETNADIIYNHTSELKALFANYEFFRINLSQLREGIKALGIKENGKVLLLYREPSNISYTSLIRALMVEEDEEMYSRPAGKTTSQMTNDLSHYDNITSNDYEVNERENPLNWGEDIPPLPEQGKYIKLKEKPPIPEVMINNLNEIQNKSQMLNDGEDIEDINNYENDDDDDGFVEPTYDECLKILRQKIYDQIRMLTSGYTNVKQFRDEMEQMNVPIPESAEHYLNQFELTGDIPFHLFVTAFDKYFDTLVETPPSPPPPPEEEDERFLELEKAIEERLKEPAIPKTATHHHGDIIAWQHDGELTDNIELIQTRNRSVLDESDPTALYWNDDTIKHNKENMSPAPIIVKKSCWAAGDSGDFITWTDVPPEATCEGPKFNKVTLLHYDSPEPPFATHENVTPDFEPGKTKTWRSSITVKQKEKTGDWLFTPPPPPPQPYQMDYPFGTNLVI